MKYEYAIERLRTADSYHTQKEYALDDEAINIAIEALEKQIPKQPVVILSDGTISIGNCRFGKNVLVHKCPECDSWVLIHHDYCSKCGQKIKWPISRNK